MGAVNQPDAPASATRPQDFAGVIPHMTLSDANAAVDFYEKAFGAEVLDRRLAGAGPRLMHCQLRINGGSLMINDGFPEQGHPAMPLQGFTLLLAVDDVVAWWDRATAAGAEIIMPLQVMFWGDRYGQLKDPFGVTWALNGKA
jgi:PhnB protein